MTYLEAFRIWWRRCIVGHTWREIACFWSYGTSDSQLVGMDACELAEAKLPSWWPGRWN